MAEARIKKEYLRKRVGCGKHYGPLFSKTAQQVNELALVALESKDPSLLKLFEVLPELSELKASLLRKKLTASIRTN